MRILRGLAWGLGILIVLLALGATWAYYHYKPQYEGTRDLAALQEEVEVLYDEVGIPHIYAPSQEAAFTALGYVHAQDRLFQMEMMRRVGAGRLAEVLGPELLPVDRFFRTLGLPAHSRASAQRFMQSADSSYQRLALAYLEGINAFVEKGPKPLEFVMAGIPRQRFTPEDLYYIVAYMSYSFDQSLKTDPVVEQLYAKLDSSYWEDLHLGYAQNHTTINSPTAPDSLAYLPKVLHQHTAAVMDALPLPVYRASNAWVLGPEKTKSGEVLFANDTHIGYSQPSVWYEAHLEAPGLKLYGNFLAGFPYPLIGHTDHHAWGLTMFLNDDLDLYRETIQGDSVRYRGRWETLIKKKELIAVKNAPTDTLVVRRSPHGPILNGVLDKLPQNAPPVAASWTLLDFPMEAVQVAYQMWAAQDMEQFYRQVNRLAAPGLNVMYGDTAGNIGWWAVAKLRKRPPHVNPRSLLDGASGRDEIQGYFPADSNPHALNPPQGYVYSANNPSRLMNGKVYPGYYYRGLRAQAITAALDTAQDWELEDSQALALTDRSPQYPQNLKMVLDGIKARAPWEAAVLKKARSWEGEHTVDSQVPVLYYPLLYQLLQQGMQDELGDTLFSQLMATMIPRRSVPALLHKENSPWWDRQNTAARETLGEIAQDAWDTTLPLLAERWGRDVEAWRWGKVHGAVHKHNFSENLPAPLASWLNVGPLPIGGGEEVINKQAFALSDGRYLNAVSGPAMRIGIDFGAVEEAESINPTGQSGNPLSPHYKDQARAFAAGQHRPMDMRKDRLLAQRYKRLLLK
jgi:penicillin amidase